MLSSNRNRNDMRILVHLKISILLELHFDQWLGTKHRAILEHVYEIRSEHYWDEGEII